jgi:serine/threonine protein kinase/tetratricopeptide (TPR) repeat protein
VEGTVQTAATLASGLRNVHPWSGRAEVQTCVGDDFELVRELGRGGFGAVWHAVERRSGADCCLKLLYPAHALGFPLVRFKREFRTGRRLQHPACVRTYELYERSGVWFFAMERVAGAPLRRTGQADVLSTLAVAQQILAALDHVHGQGIVHRDIKPQNILIQAPSPAQPVLVAKLTDFGIAKVGDLDDDERLLALRGSLPFLAPELVFEGVADARCDIYSLGVTLYLLLANRHPLSPPTETLGRNWLRVIKQRRPTALSEVAPSLPAALADIIMKMVAKDPGDRYRTAAQVHGDIAAWLSTQSGVPDTPLLPTLTGGAYLAAPRLVGRAQEQKQIAEFLRANLADDPASSAPVPPLLLLSGEAGAGKSRLLTWLLGTAEAYGPHLLVGHCRNRLGSPLESVARILDDLHRLTCLPDPDISPEPAEVDTTAESATNSLQTVVQTWHPETSFLGQLRRSGESGAASGSLLSPSIDGVIPDAQGFRQLLHQLAETLLRAASRAAIVVVIEDLHWSELETLELLTQWARTIYLARNEGRRLPIALVGTHRPADLDSPVERFRAQLVAAGQATACAVEPLGRDATEALVGELLAQSLSRDLATSCAVLFGDQPVTPLYVTQILRLLIARGQVVASGSPWDGTWDLSRVSAETRELLPRTVDQAIGQRAARLSGETKILVAVASVLGRRFPRKLLEALSELDAEMTRECVDEAIRTGFLSDDSSALDDEGLIFNHDRFREALYAQLAAETRRALHRAAADALLASSAQRGRELAADLALHYHEAGQHEPAYRFGVMAAERALRAKQCAQASNLFARAIDDADALGKRPPRKVLERFGDAASAAIHIDRSRRAYERVLAQPRNLAHRVELERKLGELYYRGQKREEALRFFTRALVTGLPRYLRGRHTPLALWAVMSPAGLVLSPESTCAIYERIFGSTAAEVRLALHNTARQASVAALSSGRFQAGTRMGFWMVTSGLSLRSARGSPAFPVACSAMEVYFAMFGRDAQVAKWRRLGLRAPLSRCDDRDRFTLHFCRGSADMILANEVSATAEFERAFAVAEAVKDPLLVEMSAAALTSLYALFHRPQPLHYLAHRVQRFCDAEDRPQLAAALRSILSAIDLLALNSQRQGAQSMMPADRQPSDAGASGNPAALLLMRCRQLATAMRAGMEPEAVVSDALDVCEEATRRRIRYPFFSLSAAAYLIALQAAAQSSTLPIGSQRRLRAVRRRPRLLELRGRWSRPQWLMAYAAHDAWRGNRRAGERRLKVVLDHCQRYGMRAFQHAACLLGLEFLDPAQPLRERCQRELDGLTRSLAPVSGPANQ